MGDIEGDLELDSGPTGFPESPSSNVDLIPRPLSPTKLTPMVHSPMRYQSDVDLEVLRRKLANAPRPLKKRSSITEPEGPSGPNIQKLLYQRFNTLAGGIEVSMGTGSSGAPFYQPTGSGGEAVADADNGNASSDVLDEIPGTEGLSSDAAPDGDDNDNPPSQPDSEMEATEDPPSSDDDNNNNTTGSQDRLSSFVPEETSLQEAESTASTSATVSITNIHNPPTFRLLCFSISVVFYCNCFS